MKSFNPGLRSKSVQVLKRKYNINDTLEIPGGYIPLEGALDIFYNGMLLAPGFDYEEIVGAISTEVKLLITLEARSLITTITY